MHSAAHQRVCARARHPIRTCSAHVYSTHVTHTSPHAVVRVAGPPGEGVTFVSGLRITSVIKTRLTAKTPSDLKVSLHCLGHWRPPALQQSPERSHVAVDLLPIFPGALRSQCAFCAMSISREPQRRLQGTDASGWLGWHSSVPHCCSQPRWGQARGPRPLGLLAAFSDGTAFGHSGPLVSASTSLWTRTLSRDAPGETEPSQLPHGMEVAQAGPNGCPGYCPPLRLSPRLRCLCLRKSQPKNGHTHDLVSPQPVLERAWRTGSHPTGEALSMQGTGRLPAGSLLGHKVRNPETLPGGSP